MTISKQRYCSKETVKDRKYPKKKHHGHKILHTPQHMKKSIHDITRANKHGVQVSNKTSNYLQNKKRGSSLKDLLNRVDQDNTGGRGTNGINHRNEMLRNIISPKSRQQMVNNGVSNILDEIIGSATNSSRKTFVKELTASNTNKTFGLLTQQGNFLDQMKKKLHHGEDPFFGKGKSHIYRKKKFGNSGFSQGNTNINASKNNSGDEYLKIKLKDKMSDPQLSKNPPAFQSERAPIHSRKPVLAKSTYNKNPKVTPLGLAGITSYKDKVKGSSRNYQPVLKSGAKGLYPKKSSLRAGSAHISGQSTTRTNGSQTDRNLKKKRGLSSSGHGHSCHRSSSKNIKSGSKYQIKTFNDFLTSSKVNNKV